MLVTLGALLPVFLTILLGFLLCRYKVVKPDMWMALEHVTYYVLFPVLLAKTLAIADLTGAPVLGISAILLIAITVLVIFLFLFRNSLITRLHLTGPAFSSLFQTSTRWNTFAALAIIAALYGDAGLTLGAIGIITLIPLLNVLSVAVVTVYADGTTPSPARLAFLVARNPIIWSCALGIIWNLTGIILPPPLLSALTLIGSGALGIGLLALGAGLDPRSAFDHRAPVLVSTALKLLVMPMLVWATARMLEADQITQSVAIICAAVPAANASYILARQLGGDAPLISSTITAQIVVSAVTLPVIIYLAGG